MGDKEKQLPKKRGKTEKRRKAAETRHSGTRASSRPTSWTENLPAWGCGLDPMAAFINASYAWPLVYNHLTANLLQVPGGTSEDTKKSGA